MRVLRYGLALLVLVLMHVFVARAFPPLTRYVDLFPVLLVFYALSGSTLKGMLGGLVVGLVADQLSGSYYGLHSLAGTLLGYASARACQHLSVQKPLVVVFFFLLAGALYEATLVVLVFLLTPNPELMSAGPLVLQAVSCGLFGVVAFWIRDYSCERYRSHRASRVVKVRMAAKVSQA